MTDQRPVDDRSYRATGAHERLRPLMADPVSSIEPFFLGYGVLGVMFVLVLFGWLRPKWDSDSAKQREAQKDVIIEKLTDALQRLADQLEGKK